MLSPRRVDELNEMAMQCARDDGYEATPSMLIPGGKHRPWPAWVPWHIRLRNWIWRKVRI